ncbi:helix-turn-helix transcriptional regulator [Anaerospora sp.]|uniref:helix-turn-helix domain-containing protein n=1 Tax=Anaerospora sp. TaxID=1960278 RepID=UPI0028972874|nr:helix-turn-helix transcriptional regulator [Anaerospora sp.]
MKTQGQILKNLRSSLALSQEALAEELGMSIKSIQRYETDKSKPDTYALVKFATYFDVSTDYLLGLLSYEGDLKEKPNIIFRDGKYNAFYSHYLKCIRSTAVDKDSEYYWVRSEDGIIGGQTMWVGYVDETCTLDVRRLRTVVPMLALAECIRICGRPMILNEVEDAMVYRMYGGHAIVKKEICERYLPEFLEDFICDPKEEFDKISRFIEGMN